MSNSRYQAYFAVEGGWFNELPAHWQKLPSNRVFEQRRESAKEDDEQLSATQKYGVVPQSLFMALDDRKVTLALAGTDNFKHVDEGNFVISLRSFEGGIELSNYSGCVSPAYTCLKARKPIANDYYKYALKCSDYILALQSVTQGIRDGKNISYGEFSRLSVPYPPLEEQLAIATFLGQETAKIDALIAEQQRLIELLQEKRQAVISHAVTNGLNPVAPMKDSGVEWLGKVPEHWEVCRVKAVSVFTTSGPRGWSERVGDVGALFVQSGDLTDVMGVDFANCKRVQVGDDAEAARTKLLDGDLVVCITGAKTGNVAVCESVPESSYVNQHLCLIRPGEGVHPHFLAALLKSGCGQTYFSLAQYGLKQGLSLDDVREAPFALPPLDEQDRICQWLRGVSSRYLPLEAESQRTISLLQERRSALISAAVTGQIDVRGLVPEASAA